MEKPYEEIGQTPEQGKSNKMFELVRLFVFTSVAFHAISANFQKSCPAVVTKELASAYHVSVQKLTVFSSVYFYPYAVTQIVAGLLNDIFDPAYVLGVFGILYSFGSIICGFSNTLSVGIIGRFLVGLGTGPIYISAIKIYSAWYKKEQLPVLLGLFLAFSTIGGMLAGAPLSWFVGKFGWRNSFYGLGGFGGVLSLLVLIFTKGSPEAMGYPSINASSGQGGQKKTVKEKIVNLYKSGFKILMYGHFWVISMFNMTNICVFLNGSGFWGGPFYRDVLGYDKIKQGYQMMSMHAGTLVGSLFLPQLVKLVGSKKWIMALSSFMLCLSALAFFFRGNHLNFWEGICYCLVYGAFARPMTSLDYPLLQEYYDASIRGSAVGMANFFLNIMSAPYQQISAEIIPKFGRIPQESGPDQYTWDGYKYGLWLFSAISAAVSTTLAFVVKDPDATCCKNKIANEEAPGTYSAPLLLNSVVSTNGDDQSLISVEPK